MNSVEKILETVISRLRTLAEIDTVVGKPIQTPDGTIVLPISKISVGFVAGGGEYADLEISSKKEIKDFPFAGGSGAGVCVTPIAFISVSNGETKLFSVDSKTAFEKIIDLVPETISSLFERVQSKVFEKSSQENESNETKIPEEVQ